MLKPSEETKAQSAASFVDSEVKVADTQATMVMDELQESIVLTEAADSEQRKPKAIGSVRTGYSIAFRARLKQDSDPGFD